MQIDFIHIPNVCWVRRSGRTFGFSRLSVNETNLSQERVAQKRQANGAMATMQGLSLFSDFSACPSFSRLADESLSLMLIKRMEPVPHWNIADWFYPYPECFSSKGEWNSFDFSRFSVLEAYLCQERVSQKRQADGARIIGYKVGCTSPEIRNQFGLADPICAPMFDTHIFMDESSIDRSDYCQCAIEPEMVIKLSRDIQPDNLSDDEILRSIEWISAGIEIHHFFFRQQPPTHQELICSGGLWAGLVIGAEKVIPHLVDNERFEVFFDSVLVRSGIASSIMGGPLNSLRWLAKFLFKEGTILRQGDLVIPGSPVALFTIETIGSLEIRIENIGKVRAAIL